MVCFRVTIIWLLNLIAVRALKYFTSDPARHNSIRFNGGKGILCHCVQIIVYLSARIFASSSLQMLSVPFLVTQVSI